MARIIAYEAVRRKRSLDIYTFAELTPTVS